MKAQITKISLMIATAGMLSFAAGSAFAQDRCDRGERPDRDAVERTVELTEDGAVMTIVGADEETIAHIQERAVEHEERGMRWADDATIETEFTDDGVQVTFSSTDPEIVARIQEHAEEGPRGHRGERGDGDGERGERGERGGFMDSVDFESVDTADGVEITLTSDDADVVAEIIEHAADGPPIGRRGGDGPDWMEDVESSVEELSNGVRITLSSDDAEIVERLQEHEPGQHRERSRRGERGERGERGGEE